METTTIYNEENDVINKFVINVILIDPIYKIIEKLKNREFRDIDIKYLDRKLKCFTSFACKTLNIDFSFSEMIDNDRSGVIMNDYIVDQYIERFTILLQYFESL